MLANFEENLLKYAKLLVAKGINVQPGDWVKMTISVDQAPLARLVTKEAYALGAEKVIVKWADDEISKMPRYAAQSRSAKNGATLCDSRPSGLCRSPDRCQPRRFDPLYRRAADGASEHGNFPFSSRGADARCNHQAPALQGQCGHQPHGNRRWHAGAGIGYRLCHRFSAERHDELPPLLRRGGRTDASGSGHLPLAGQGAPLCPRDD